MRHAVLHSVDQRRHVIAADEQQHDERIADRDHAVAHAVEHAFDDMREADDVVEPEQSGRSLDGMGRTEDCIDVLRLQVGALDGEQRRFHVLEQLAAFDDKSL